VIGTPHQGLSALRCRAEKLCTAPRRPSGHSLRIGTARSFSTVAFFIFDPSSSLSVRRYRRYIRYKHRTIEMHPESM